MALRVTQGLMYNSFVGNMNRNLGALMESNIQSSSQKRVNRPSDDPVSAARILRSRDTLNKLSTYKANTEMAMGWLNLADYTLASGDGSVQTLLSRLQVLAEQGATGSYSAENRLEISSEVRQLFEGLIQLSNTTFNGNQIFAGHKVDTPAYTEGLAVTCKDSETEAAGLTSLAGARFNVSGALERTMILQATEDGAADNVSYRYSMDGGSTWQEVESLSTDPATGVATIVAGGVSIRFNAQDDDGNTHMVTGVPPLNDPTTGPDDESYRDNGTWLYIRPTAIYQGDDHDTQVAYGYGTISEATANGYFTRDVAVRIDDNDGTTISYSYSLDDGSNWTSATAPVGQAGADTHLLLPGGYLAFDMANTPNVDEQFIVHPHRADINYQIGENDAIAVNNVGKNIFGGYYNYPGDKDASGNPIDYPVRVDEGQANLFEAVGELIAALETNDQAGCQAALPKLKDAMTMLLTKAAEVGGRENRLITTQAALVMRQYSEEDNLSSVEDIDITELMTRLSQQQVAYNSVLKSSSMIMQMSLVNFL